MSFHISRWRYWWAYLVIIVLVMYAIWLTDRAADMASWTAGIAAFILLVMMEIVIRRERIAVNGAVDIIRGKSRTQIPFNSISSVSVSQSVLQNLLRYGTVFLKTPGEEITLSSFEEPNKIKKQIESRMHVAHQKHLHHEQKPHVGP